MVAAEGEIASDTPARLLGGASGEAFPVLSRTGSLLARFGLEGGPARTAAEIELSTTTLDVQLTGLISSIFADAEFDLDANLSAPRSRIALMHMFPAWRLPSGIAGPLLAEGTVKGRAGPLRGERQGRCSLRAQKLMVPWQDSEPMIRSTGWTSVCVTVISFNSWKQ